jgi:TatD DNase family protein
LIPINIHTHLPHRSENTIELVSVQLNKGETPGENAFCSAGWHPWDAQKASLERIRETIVAAIQWPQTIALGECGLDRVCRVDLEIQKRVFLLHLKSAEEYHLPLIIHCVKAFSDLLQELKRNRFKGRMVLHAFSGNRQQIESLLNYHVYFSVGSEIISETPRLIESLHAIPPDRLFLETDISEVPILALYQKAAEIKGIEVEELEKRITENLKALFPKTLPEGWFSDS